VNESVVWLTIFVLSVFVGIEVISKVSSTLHTPLMSGANAIHGVILSAPSWSPGGREHPRAGRRAGRGGAGDDQHGRRLRGHRPDAADVHRARSPPIDEAGGRRMTPTWVQLAYLVAAVCFILALKGLLPAYRPPRGNLIGALGAVIAPSSCSSADLDHVVPILIAIAVGTVIGVPARSGCR
jgi:hypothetical protein